MIPALRRTLLQSMLPWRLHTWAGKAGGQAAMLHASGVPVLTASLSHGSGCVVTSSASALSLLASKDQGRAVLIASGAVAALLGCLAHARTSVVLAAAFALVGVGSNTAGNHAVLALGGPALLAACLDHPDEGLVRRVIAAVGKLAAVPAGSAALWQQEGAVPKLLACMKHGAAVAAKAKEAFDCLGQQHNASKLVPALLSFGFNEAHESTQKGSLQDL